MTNNVKHTIALEDCKRNLRKSISNNNRRRTGPIVWADTPLRREFVAGDCPDNSKYHCILTVVLARFTWGVYIKPHPPPTESVSYRQNSCHDLAVIYFPTHLHQKGFLILIIGSVLSILMNKFSSGLPISQIIPSLSITHQPRSKRTWRRGCSCIPY